MPKSKQRLSKQPRQRHKLNNQGSRKAATAGEKVTKAASIVSLLSRPSGATIDEILKATGWQTHSVRGFFAGYVRKKLKMTLSSEKNTDGVRCYRIVS